MDPLLVYPMCASLFLRVWFSAYMLIWVPFDYVILWDVENFVTISLPAWGISGIACAPPPLFYCH